jgi:hypothetical protein
MLAIEETISVCGCLSTARSGGALPMSVQLPAARFSAVMPLRWLCLIILLGLAAACGELRLVSPYDEQLDKGTSAAHTAIATFVDKMGALAGNPKGSFEENREFYTDLVAKLSTLKLRAAAPPGNEITVNLFDELIGNVQKLRALHETNGAAGLPPELGKPALAALDVNCSAILKFEIAKKRGDAN